MRDAAAELRGQYSHEADFCFHRHRSNEIAEIQQMRVELIEFHQISIELLLEGQSFT